MQDDDNFILDEPIDDWRVIYKDDNPDEVMYSYKLEGKLTLFNDGPTPPCTAASWEVR